MEKSKYKRIIFLSLDRVSGKLFFTDFKDFLGKETKIGFLGYCEKVDKLFWLIQYSLWVLLFSANGFNY